MTGNKHNHEGNSGDSGEPEPGPYWKRMHRDWRFWIGAVLMAAALSVYVLSGDLAWVPHGHPQQAMPATGSVILAPPNQPVSQRPAGTSLFRAAAVSDQAPTADPMN
jgi:hypothetical protein